jgi:hypothetical protein
MAKGSAVNDNGRIVIVGASLAGLRAAEALHKEGFCGHLTIIGDEPGEPYDRPPLSKQDSPDGYAPTRRSCRGCATLTPNGGSVWPRPVWTGSTGWCAARLGTALALKPLLRIDGGKLVLAGQRVHTASKAVAAMIDRVCDDVAATLRRRLPACGEPIVTDLGPVLALHVGAGAVGVVVDAGSARPP